MSVRNHHMNEDATIGETVKRKNIGDEIMRESQLEMETDKNERLSETIFWLMLELKMAKKEIKSLRMKVAEPGGLNDLSLIGGDVREKLDYLREANERLEKENSSLRFHLDKLKNLEIEHQYYKDNFTKIEELYLLEQQKRKFLETKMGRLETHEISMIEETFEEKFKFTKVEEYKHVEYAEEIRRGPPQPGDEDPENISLLSKNIQKKVRQNPGQYNLRANNLEREVFILNKEVDRLNFENQKFIEENLILAQRLKGFGVDAPDFLSDKFASGGPGIDKFGSELVEPTEIEIPGGNENFPQLLSNDNTFFLKEQIQKLEAEAEIYVETIKELEDRNDELKRRNIKLDNALRLARKDNFRESAQMERENQDLKDQVESLKLQAKVALTRTTSSPSPWAGACPASTSRRSTQKQRELVYYKQELKDNNIPFDGQMSRSSPRDAQENIVEEDEVFFDQPRRPEEREVNAGLPGHLGDSREARNSADVKSDADIMVSPSLKDIGVGAK